MVRTTSGKGFVYKLIPKDDEFSKTGMYVGSSFNIKRRMLCHKNGVSNVNHLCYKSKVYNHIRENGGFERYKMVILEEIAHCNNEDELIAVEIKWFDRLSPCLNSSRPVFRCVPCAHFALRSKCDICRKKRVGDIPKKKKQKNEVQ